MLPFIARDVAIDRQVLEAVLLELPELNVEHRRDQLAGQRPRLLLGLLLRPQRIALGCRSANSHQRRTSAKAPSDRAAFCNSCNSEFCIPAASWRFSNSQLPFDDVGESFSRNAGRPRKWPPARRSRRKSPAPADRSDRRRPSARPCLILAAIVGHFQGQLHAVALGQLQRRQAKSAVCPRAGSRGPIAAEHCRASTFRSGAFPRRRRRPASGSWRTGSAAGCASACAGSRLLGERRRRICMPFDLDHERQAARCQNRRWRGTRRPARLTAARPCERLRPGQSAAGRGECESCPESAFPG